MKSAISWILALGLITSAVAWAEEEKAPERAPLGIESLDADHSGSYYLCKSGATVRTIRISKSGAVCRTYYTKEGVDAVVSKSSNPQTCGDVAGRIKTNLEASNWKCKDISNSRVSSNVN